MRNQTGVACRALLLGTSVLAAVQCGSSSGSRTDVGTGSGGSPGSGGGDASGGTGGAAGSTGQADAGDASGSAIDGSIASVTLFYTDNWGTVYGMVPGPNNDISMESDFDHLVRAFAVSGDTFY